MTPKLRQDFLKGFQTIADNKEVVCQSIGMDVVAFDTMVEYFNTQINKTKTVEKGGNYKPTEKASAILDVLIAFEGEYKTGKEIAEASQGLLKANGVSGSIRGLVSNGFVEATNDSPKKYSNDYRFFEHTVIPSEKNSDGTVTVYYYTRREITEIMKDLLYKEVTIGSFKLAIRSANLIRERKSVV